MSNSQGAQIDEARILKELEGLVKETFMLWDEKRIGFSWRHYFFNHTQRVRALSVTIAKNEGADHRKIEYASLLHDITKRYDGGFLTDKDGKRIVNEDGFWLNETLLPKRTNIVTQLYDEHNLAQTLHNVSGAVITERLLKNYGFPDDFCADVGSIVLTHLKPNETSTEKIKAFNSNLEGRILYEADTIDSNLGLTAFFRNIGIHTYYMVERTGRIDLKEYIDGIPRWLNMKEEFLPRMQTETGRRIADARQKRNWEIWSWIEREKENFEVNEQYGVLGVVKYFMDCYDDPNMSEQMAYLENEWIPARKLMLESENSKRELSEQGLKSALEMYSLIVRECMGEI